MNRKIPETKVAKDDENQAFKIVDGTSTRRSKIEKYANHVMWSSALKQKLSDGLLTKIVAFFHDEEPHYWSLQPDSNQVILTPNEAHATAFKLKSKDSDKVSITTTDDAFILCVKTNSKIIEK